MINQARCQARNNAGFTLIIDMSDSGFRCRKPKLVLGCERADEYI